MSGQVSRGSAGEYQADEQAGVARLRCRAGQVSVSCPSSPGEMGGFHGGLRTVAWLHLPGLISLSDFPQICILTKLFIKGELRL